MLDPVSAITAYMTHLFNSIGVAHCCCKVLHTRDRAQLVTRCYDLAYWISTHQSS